MPQISELHRTTRSAGIAACLLLLSPTASLACGNLMSGFALPDDRSSALRELLALLGLLLSGAVGLRRVVRGFEQGEWLLRSVTFAILDALAVAAGVGFVAAVLSTPQVQLVYWLVCGCFGWIALSLLGWGLSVLRTAGPRIQSFGRTPPVRLSAEPRDARRRAA